MVGYEHSARTVPHTLWLLYALGSVDLLIDKQELVRNKVLEANSLCGSDAMDVSVRRQFEGKIFGFRKIPESLSETTRYTVRHSFRCFVPIGFYICVRQ